MREGNQKHLFRVMSDKLPYFREMLSPLDSSGSPTLASISFTVTFAFRIKSEGEFMRVFFLELIKKLLFIVS